MGYQNTEVMNNALKAFIDEWSILINAFLGIALLLGLLAFGYGIALLIQNAENPQGRQDAIKRILKAGFTTTFIGAFWTLVWAMYAIFL